MGDDSLILREDGYIRMNFPVTSVTYHSNLNIILVKSDSGTVHVLDVNSGVILQSTSLSADEGGAIGVDYVPGADRVFVWDQLGVGARTDYNGVLLLHTVLQRPLASSQSDSLIKIELVLSEAVLLYQCLQSLDVLSIEGLADFINELKYAIDAEPVRKGVKAQKWSTVTIQLSQSTLRLVTTGVVQELKGQNRRIPALAIASAVGHRANELVPCSRDEESRALMYSEAERKETFKRWPHMDYKWALPARMAQAGFYHQPSPSGDDRAMCFTCMVCLVCWEKSDEPWVEHERHSPNCSFVRGEYTHNVPISVTNATACAVPNPNVSVVSKGNTGDMVAVGTTDGKVNIYKFDCGLKLVKYIHLSPYDSIFSGILTPDYNKVWSTSLEKDSSTYGLELTAMAFLGLTSAQEPYAQAQNAESVEKDPTGSKTKPSLICAVTITRTMIPSELPSREEDASKALFDQGADQKESVQAMNDENEAKSNLASIKMLFLLTYDVHSSLAGSTTVVHTSSSGNSKPGGSKKMCTVARADDSNIYDEICLQYSDDDTELPQCTKSFLDDSISNVINLNASSSKDDAKAWDSKQLMFSKHFKIMPPPPPTALLPELPEAGQTVSLLDFVGKMSQLKSWKSGNLDSVGTKLADQTDAGVLQHADPITHYLNMNGPLEISDLKWYEGGDGTEKVKVTSFGGSKSVTLGQMGPISYPSMTNDGVSTPCEPPPEEVITQGIAVQCLSLPTKLNLSENSKVTHLLPTEDKEHVLVVISSIDPEKIKKDTKREATDSDGDVKMDVDEATEATEAVEMPENYAYFILYKINNKTSLFTLEDNPVTMKELPYGESPVDLCFLPPDKQEQYSFASVGVDGALRMYCLPDFKVLSEKRVPKGQFTSVVYCASVERLSVSTKHGMIYFYALNNGEKDTAGDIDEDDFANIDFDMLSKAPRDEVCGPMPAPVIIPHKTELDMADLETLISLTGSYGTTTTVPYSAVVPGFWCELSPAQRSRSDHQHNRTWRLQNTSSTWDEHVLELTLPYSVCLAHIEFSFTLHMPCTVNLPIIQVTLLKQNHHGIGYKKDASFGQRPDSPVFFPLIDSDVPSNLENPVNSEEYLQAHNAEILAGPVLLSSGLDLTQQSGTLILTSPRIFRARGRTFLIHIKTLFDPAKDMGKTPAQKNAENNAKKAGFIGCDWLHQISISVRSSPHIDVPMERQQRIAMLESNAFLNTLFEIASSKTDFEKRKLALDLLIWVIAIRLQRLRLTKEKGKDGGKDTQNPIENQQLECIKVVEKYVHVLIKNCILCSKRSVAKKCIKIILITSEGVKQLAKPWKSTFEQTLTNSVSACIPLLGACDSPGAMKWLVALAQHVTNREAATGLVSRCLALLERTAKCIRERGNVYHHLLRARFGLYGLPLERTIFDMQGPTLGKSTSSPVTYASVLVGDANTPAAAAPKPDYQLKDLFNLTADMDGKSPPSNLAWWTQNNGVGVFGYGLSESMPLHVTCHVASDGTKLESSGSRHHAAVVNTLPGDPSQLWTVVKEGQMKLTVQDPDSLEDAESSSPMDCDPQEKLDFTDERFFQEQEQCGIPWAQLVTRPPQHTLVVERMHSGARRYIVLDFGHTVRLTDVIIPSCSDLVTLCIDIWVRGEETDSVKLAFATDIASKHLVLSDIQPPPRARYMKITTIGRYGMSAMKCKIPLGWFYGEIDDISNVQASVNSLNALQQDLTCRFRLATGKLMDLLNPYLELYNGNAAHMMAYLNLANESDPKVMTAYHECIELQQQLHTCTNILTKLQSSNDCNEQVLDMINKGQVDSEALLERASTDKLRVMCENIVDMLLYFYFQVGDVRTEEMSVDWCSSMVELVWAWGGAGGAALATLLARVCGGAAWWGDLLADTLAAAFAAVDAPPLPLDRVLVLIMYMGRRSLTAHAGAGGVAAALASRALQLLRAPPAPAVAAATLTALAGALDAQPRRAKHARWDWVTGGRAGAGGAEAPAAGRAADCRLHRRKLHKKLLHQMHQMQELDAARRQVQLALEEQQRARFSIKARMAMLGKRGGSKSEGGGAGAEPRPPRLVPLPLARELAQALVQHMLAMDSSSGGDTMLLCAKVVGRLCALSGGASLLDPSCILGLARLAVTLPPWPRHALTTLLQDLVEYESGPTQSADVADWSLGAGSSSRVIRVSQDDHFTGKAARKPKQASVADVLADSFGLEKTSNPAASSPKPNVSNEIKNAVMTMECLPLQQVAESDDSESEEKLEQYFLDAVKKETKAKPPVDTSTSNISACLDARLESGTEGSSEAAARRLLLAGSGALAAAIKAPPISAARPPDEPPPPRTTPPLTHTLPDVFRQLAMEFPNQMDCTFMENVIALWLTINGSGWGAGSPWSLGGLAVPSDGPRVRLSADTVAAMLLSLCQLDNVSLRCWVLCMQALAWNASLPLQTEGSTQTMGRVILECEHFVPAVVKFVTMNVATDGAVITSEPYLGGVSVGAGAGAASALHSVLSRVVCGRGAAGAVAALRIVCGVWNRQSPSGCAYDLQAALLRAAHPLLQNLSAKHEAHALQLIESVATLSASWVTESVSSRTTATVVSDGASDVRLSGLLADVLGGGSTGSAGASRRAPLRRSVLAQLLHYCRRLLALPQPLTAIGAQALSPRAEEVSQTDESKATQQLESTNLEDERKQQAARTPCVADSVLSRPHIIQRFYKTLSMCDSIQLSSSLSTESPAGAEPASLKEEVFWLVAHVLDMAVCPQAAAPTLIDFLRKEEITSLSCAMRQLLIRVLDKPEALGALLELGLLELAVDKLTKLHQMAPNNSQGLVSSLMNYLKLPPQIYNMSQACNTNKKTQPPLIENSNGLTNFGPLCTVTCGNPTAQAADVLLGVNVNNSGACAARRVRAAAWSYHFFSADDASLALTLTLPYAVQLHEVQLQPHVTSLATCPGAVAVEAGCGGTLAPLGPPQNTAGMTFIRLVVCKPIVCTTVQIRLYKPRDSSNMGLLHLKLLGVPAFNKMLPNNNNPNNWASIVAACTRGRLPDSRWTSVTSPGALAALSALLVAGGSGGAHAAHTLLAAARACPALRAPLLHALLNMPPTFQSGSTRSSGGVRAVCALVQQLCVTCAAGSVEAYTRWLAAAAERYLRHRTAVSAAPLYTVAAVLWTLKEENLLENLEELITDDLFELIYTWVKDVPEDSMLKKSLDSILCSMCYIRPVLFRMLLEQMDVPMEETANSMESQTDDRKVSSPQRAPPPPRSNMAVRLAGRRLATAGAAALSPSVAPDLLLSGLPHAVAHAVTDFSIAKLQEIKAQVGSQEDIQMTDSEKQSTSAIKPETADMKTVCQLVEWLRQLCMERRLKDWLGAAGAVFWRPLLHLLCYPRPAPSTWQEGAQYAELEESTIRLFAELTTCHADNQKLFASTLHNIVETLHCTGPEGISGFTRALILRLLLSSERVRVGLRWGAAGAGGASPGRHPAEHSLTVVDLPTHTTVRTLLREHRPPVPQLDDTAKFPSMPSSSGSASYLVRRASDTAISTAAEVWELSIAAASASKDKRIKDVKNTTLKQQQVLKRQNKASSDAAVQSATDEIFETNIRVTVAGISGSVPAHATLAQLSAAAPHVFGPHLTVNFTPHQPENPSNTWEGASETTPASSFGAVLREFGACGGLALMAARLPRPRPAPLPAPRPARPDHDDWVKLDDPYEEVVELGVGSGSSSSDEASCGGVPPHALLALGLLLKLPGYAAALLDEGARAVHLLRLLLGVTHDEDGRSIVVGGTNGSGSWSLGTLPFVVVARQLEASPLDSARGVALRRALLTSGTVRLLLACLAVFTHHHEADGDNSQGSNGSGKTEAEKSQLYWAKGTGFGTGSTQQSWNVEQALVRQRTEEHHATALMQVLASYMNPGEQWPPDEGGAGAGGAALGEPADLPAEFVDLVAASSLVPALCSYLRNDSVLDVSRHIPLYVCVLRCARALYSLHSRKLQASIRALPRLLKQMSRTTNSYATKLRMSKKNIYGKMTYAQRFCSSSNSELSEEDEGLATLIADIQATAALMCGDDSDDDSASSCVPRPVSGASREARYIEVMRRLQFETFEMIEECPSNGYRFTVPYHFEGTVRAAGERAHPQRMKRLAQEAATLATSLPLSYSSSVFVRTDTDRLDVMKVLITGPSDTPYANGCFVLDVYFPAEYPAAPMLINLETTGRHSVRFNPNLYNDGKVCLSVLNTWHGRPEEKWNASTSSFLQVLVSIQSLILVPEPYFNEPGYERSRGTRQGSSASLEYNSNIYQACVRWAMLDHLRNPSPCFKEVIQTHFWMKRNEIMSTVAAWLAELEAHSGDERAQRTIQLNLMALKRHYVKIQEELAKLPVPPGLEDLDEPFTLPAAPSPPPPAPAAPPTNDEIDHDMEKIVSQVLD